MTSRELLREVRRQGATTSVTGDGHILIRVEGRLVGKVRARHSDDSSHCLRNLIHQMRRAGLWIE